MSQKVSLAPRRTIPVSEPLSQFPSNSESRAAIWTLNEEYELHSKLLEHSSITPMNRAKLYIWLMDESHKQSFKRETYALTVRYVDMFFCRGGQIDINDYQSLALGAFILAAKVCESNVPSIDLSVFSRQELLKMQMLIVLRLDYFLNPPSHIEMINRLANMWDDYCSNYYKDPQTEGQRTASTELYPKIRYLSGQSRTNFLRMKTLYQKMDCINLILKTFDYHAFDVVLSLFYIQTHIYAQDSILLEKENRQTSNTSDCSVQKEKTEKKSQKTAQSKASTNTEKQKSPVTIVWEDLLWCRTEMDLNQKGGYDESSLKSENNPQQSIKKPHSMEVEGPCSPKTEFQCHFQRILSLNSIPKYHVPKNQILRIIQPVIQMKTSDEIPNQGRTFSEMLSYQTKNAQAMGAYKKSLGSLSSGNQKSASNTSNSKASKNK